MVLAMLAAICAGAFASTTVLWALGVGGTPAGAMDRLQGLGGRRQQQSQTDREPSVSLRQRASVNLGGINLVSGKLVENWTADLERAGLTLTPKEYLILRLVAGLVLTLAGFLFSPLPVLGLVGLPIGYWAVGFWVQRRIKIRRAKLEEQLVELLQMLASGMRAGFGFAQSLDTAGNQLVDPISSEIKRTLRDIAVGASVEQALEALNKRVGSSDFDIVVTAILIQRTVGGNLAEILNNVEHTMRERERIRGEIRTLTSQQRLTGFVIGGIPVGLFFIFYLINPEFTSLLITEPLGNLMLGGAVVMEFMGFLVIRKIVNIEV